MTNHRTKRIAILLAGVVLGALAYAAMRPQEQAVPVGDRPGEVTNADMLRPEIAAAVAAEDAAYFEDRVGYFARPSAPGNYPGVVMIHEWWGLNDHIKDMARQLAGQGYQVLAVDLHGKVATTPDEARALTGALDQAKAIENMRAAADFLRAKGADRMASLGWCFGGGQSMQFALSGEPLEATVIYYGQLVTDAERLDEIAWPVLGVFGETDQSIKAETARAFDAALDEAGVENEVYIYPGVGHAFANPSGMNYAATETADAWAKTLAFLERALKE